MSWRDDDVEEFEDGPDEVETSTVPCPHCFHAVYDDAEWCPGCGLYLSEEDAPSRRPWWLVLGVLACLVVVAGWIVR